MTKKIIVANWKMNPESPREAKEIFNPVKRVAVRLRNVTTVVCPPAVYLPACAGKTLKSFALGAQDCWPELTGAYTGKLGPTILRNVGAEYLIIGHSETRSIYSEAGRGVGDNDAVINEKIKLSLKHGLKVVFCVGERVRDYEGLYLAEVKTQIEEGLKGINKKQLPQIMVAYEPVWAIGARAIGVDTPAGFHEQAIYIRKVLAGIFGKEAALKVPVLYGGSVNSSNTEGFLVDGHADGLLVGRSSLDPEEFIKILKMAESAK